MVDLTIILPARNEVEAIGRVIDEIREAFSEPLRILVVDGRSTDGTPDVARGKGVEVLVGQGKGKGLDVRSILSLIDTTYLVMLNADYTYPPQYLATIYWILSHTKADVVVGIRTICGEGSMSQINSLGNWALSLLASILYRRRVYDVCSGMWGFRTEALGEFNLTSKGFTLEADLFINTIKNKCRLEQVPIEYRKRLGGSKPKLALWDGFKIGWFLVKKRFSK